MTTPIQRWNLFPNSWNWSGFVTDFWWLGGKSVCNAGDSGAIPGSGRSPGGGNGNPLQYSCLGNPMDRGAWRATVHRVAGSDTTELLTVEIGSLNEGHRSEWFWAWTSRTYSLFYVFLRNPATTTWRSPGYPAGGCKITPRRAQLAQWKSS